MDVSALRMREATIAAALWLSVAVGLLGAIYVGLTWSRPHRTQLLILFVLALGSAITVYCIPRERIVRSRIREPFFLLWTLSDFALLIDGTLADGGTSSPLVLVFFLPVVFSSMSYPLASVAVVAVAGVGSFLTVALVADGSSTAFELSFGFSLLCTGVMSAWQAQNHKRQHRALALASRTDPLTGCLNRRGFNERAEAELAELARQGRRCAVVALDIDHFKPVNDTFGHAAGDELLCWFASTLQDAVRVGDAVGRLGGDEFSVLLTEIDGDDIAASTARIEAALGTRAPASLGVAIFPDDGEDLEALSRCADARLYASRRGRAAIASAEPPRPPLAPPAPVSVQEEDLPTMRLAPAELWRAALEAMPARSREDSPPAEPDLQQSLLEQIDASVVATDLDGFVISWNSGAEALYGWSEQEAVGRSARELMVPEDFEAAARLAEEVRTVGRWDGELLVRRRDGSLFTVYVRNRLVRDTDGNPAAIVGVAVDISARVAAENELLQSRNYAQAVTEFMGEGLLTTDLDRRITYVNRAAEAILGRTADELRGRPLEQLIADGSPSPHATDEEYLRVDDGLFRTGGGRELPVSYTVSPFNTDEGLKGSIVIFQDITERKEREAEQRRDAETLEVIDRVERAVLAESFVLHAQPIVDLKTGEVVNHELLIRLCEPDGRLISPGEFLPVAERYALVGEIDWWVIKQACRIAGAGCPVQLNVSARSIGDPDVLEHFARCIEQWEVPPGKLVVEITETAIVEDQEAARAFAERLHELGCLIALDDFGTGYGTLTYLKQIPVDFLKLDIEFVRDLVTNPASRHVVQAVLTLARNFDLQTVGEGVEDALTLELLAELGVDYAQGFHIARPAPFDEVPGDLAESLSIEPPRAAPEATPDVPLAAPLLDGVEQLSTHRSARAAQG